MSDTFGRYELLKRLGGGGMGEVFLARQQSVPSVEKLVVVKMLHPGLAENDEFANQFLDEARLAAQLNHPNVCQLHDLGRTDGVLYMAMELVRGDDLERLLSELGRLGQTLPPALAVRIAADAAAGLQHAHELTDAQGRPLEIIHRDVSPPNIMVTWDGEVKLLDFGLAKAANQLHVTKGATLKGKFAYMAPEQINSEPVDRRSDLFSLGIVLWELLTGQRLFRRDGEMETLAAVARCEVPAPSSVNRDLPASLDAVVLKALRAAPGKRYQDAQAFRLALEDWLRKEREPTSNLYLAKYMQQLYRARIQTEREKGLVADLPTGPLWRRPKKAQVVVEPAEPSAPAPRLDPPPPAPSPVVVPTPAVQAPTLRRRTIVAVGISVALAVGLGGALAWSFRAPPPATPSAPDAVAIRIDSAPQGAAILHGSRTLGTTPFVLRTARGNEALSLRLALDGYAAVDLTVKPDHDGAALVSLPPATRAR